MVTQRWLQEWFLWIIKAATTTGDDIEHYGIIYMYNGMPQQPWNVSRLVT